MEQGKPVRRDHTSGRGNVTYPPLDVIKPVAGDVWVVDSGPLHAFGLSMPVRMTVLRLRNGDLLLHSPTRHTSELHRSLQQLGAIRHLIAPNIAHWSFADAWQRACPGSLLWAAPKLKERGQVKRAGLRIDRELGATAPPEWSDEIGQVLIEGGAGFREVALFHSLSRTLVLTDFVVNLEPEKLPLPMRLFMRLAGSVAPDGKAPLYLRLLILMKRRKARASARQLLALEPQRVIFAHGAWFAEDATERLRHSLRWLGN